MRVVFFKLLLPVLFCLILFEPYLGIVVFVFIGFVRPSAFTWGTLDARFALVISIATLVGWLLHFRESRQQADRFPPHFLWFLAVVFCMTLSTLGAEASVEQSWLFVSKFYKYAVFLFLMVQMINTLERFRYVMETLFWGVSFLVVWGCQQYTAGNYRLENVGGGDFVDSSALAALFNILFPTVLNRLNHPDRWVQWTGLFFAPIYLIALTFTESRSGFLGAIAAIAIIFLRSDQKLRYMLAGIPVLILVGIFMPASFVGRMETTAQIDVSSGRHEENSADSRFRLWAVAWVMFLDHPFFGVGRGNYGLTHTPYGYRLWYDQLEFYRFEDLFLQYRVVHNMLLDLLVSNGIITFIPWCLMLACIPLEFSRIRAVLGRDPHSRFWRQQTYAFEAGIVAFIITGLFQDLAELEVFYWIVILCGICVTVLRRDVRLKTEEASEPTPILQKIKTFS